MRCVGGRLRSPARIYLSEHEPDFVILDLMLPDGDGADILRDLRTSGSCAKVIVVTGISDAQRMRDVQALGPYRFVRKPFDIVDLLSAMNMMET